SGDLLRVDRFARDHAMPRKKRLCEGGSALGGRSRRLGKQRPAALAARRTDPPRAEGTPEMRRAAIFLRRPAQVRSERRERIVRDLAGPDQVPQRLQEVGGECAGRRRQVGEERGAAPAQLLAELLAERAFRFLRGRREQPRGVREVQRAAAVAASRRFDAAPDRLSGGEEDVEIAWAERLDPRGKDFALERARDQRRALKLLDGAEQGIEAPARPRDPLPVGEKAAQRGGVHGLHLLAQLRERAALESLEDLRVDPFAASAVG